MLSLQTLAKKVVACNYLSSDYDYTLQRFGLWWDLGPIHLCNNCKQVFSYKHLQCFSEDDLCLEAALVKAVKSDNLELIRLFVDWGANPEYGLIRVPAVYLKRLCAELGGLTPVSEPRLLEILKEVARLKSCAGVLLGYDMFCHNPLLETVTRTTLDTVTYTCSNIPLTGDTAHHLLTKFWFALALRHNFTKAIHYFYKRHKNHLYWRVACSLYFNNIFDIHELCREKEICISPNLMMKFACLREKNYAAIYYCHRLGASLDYGMNLSIYNNNTLNMFFCIDLGAADFDRAQLIAHKAYMYNLSNIFLVKQLFSRDVTLVLDVTEPQEIYDMLKTYTSKNLKRAEEYLTAHPEIIVID
ncbi:MGF 360-14L [African swine fever virus]|uniref:MGF 360-14L CDS protein n=3 Tax=African swine fever virus TaxID=10497 RepID=A0A2X0THN8_ASF|nr:hypothetical protein IM014_gp055 [African swine fever virus]QTZ19842.1 MGF 360-14L [synthetic construct]AXZ95801.1 MGF_360-14L [African swine fever virus]AXZ95989.1 MGF_360-14L [African swine fever virus]AXZ96084.1 MGF_360-14L [African swine fever virus]AYW33994.1 MGF_360-14L [African swine fever virus]